MNTDKIYAEHLGHGRDLCSLQTAAGKGEAEIRL